MNKYFYWWAFMDIDHKGNIKDTYFYESADEVAEMNLSMIKSLSSFIIFIGVVVIAMSLTFFNAPTLALIYVGIIVIELAAILCALLIQRSKRKVLVSNLLSSIYLLHLLEIGSVLGTVYSKKESALVYVVVLVISQMIFILPPVLTAFMSSISLISTLIISYNVKSIEYFKLDIINCVGVFILSILLGWKITKIRIEEAQARNEAINLSEKLKNLSLVDQLTNLQNHRSFQNMYYDLYEKYKKQNKQIGIIMMDIDKFKQYNDGYGHLEGDNCLNKIGNCFIKLQSEDIIPFRFGGEEFVVIIKGEACDHIKDIAEEFRKSVLKLNIAHKYSSVSEVVTISAGYYLGEPSETDMPMQLVDCADRALYKSKRSGGNRVS